jgi:hypothetical protein
LSLGAFSSLARGYFFILNLPIYHSRKKQHDTIYRLLRRCVFYSTIRVQCSFVGQDIIAMISWVGVLKMKETLQAPSTLCAMDTAKNDVK